MSDMAFWMRNLLPSLGPQSLGAICSWNPVSTFCAIYLRGSLVENLAFAPFLKPELRYMFIWLLLFRKTVIYNGPFSTLVSKEPSLLFPPPSASRVNILGLRPFREPSTFFFAWKFQRVVISLCSIGGGPLTVNLRGASLASPHLRVGVSGGECSVIGSPTLTTAPPNSVLLSAFLEPRDRAFQREQ